MAWNSTEDFVDHSTINAITDEIFPTPSDTGPESVCFWYRVILSMVLATIITIFGLVGNTLSFLVMWSDRKTSATAFLLMALAVVDNLVLIMRFMMKQVPFTCSQTMVCLDYVLFYDTYMRAYAWAFNSINHMSNTYIVVAVTVQRYIAVCWPLKATKYASLKVAKIQVAVIVVCSAIFYIFRELEWKVISVPVPGSNVTTLARVKTEIGRSSSYTMGYAVIADSIVMYILPLSLLIILTIFLTKAVRDAKEKKKTMQGLPSATQISSAEKKREKDDRDITMSLIVVVIVFIICQLSNPIRRVLAAVYGAKENKCSGKEYYFYHDVHNMSAVVNSAVNIIIYSLFGVRFKRKLIAMLCKRAEVSPSSETSTSGTNVP